MPRQCKRLIKAHSNSPLSPKKRRMCTFTWLKLSLAVPISHLPRSTQLSQLLDTTSRDKSDIYQLHELYQIPPRA